MSRRVFVTGAAGLVGQNLIASLAADPEFEIVGVDKHRANLAILRSLQPNLRLIEADLAEPGPWEAAAAECDAIVMLQAQIGGLKEDLFVRNNIVATRRVLDAVGGRASHLVHVSSSVVKSAAVDFYTESKKQQEALVRDSGIPHVILRPTLMFGWFDRKHLGWLKRFLARAPVFPVPGDGRYPRQPLYGGDFSAIVASCLRHRLSGAYNITGLETIDYIDLIRAVRETAGLRTPIVKIPYGVFHLLLATYALFDRDPPFTTSQLRALATPDVFEVIDWPTIFGVRPTPLEEALRQTFLDPRYSDLVLEF